MADDFKVDFFIVGAARSGTTSLYHYLNQHPNIFLPNVKECNYFSTVESKDPFTYKNPKPNQHYHMKIINSYDVYKDLYSTANDHQLKGEISPSYLWDLNAANKISIHNQDAKILITLRDPIFRAFSHYMMHFNTGYEKESDFESALESEKENIWGGGNLYLEISKYFEQVKRYYDCFPVDQIKVIIYEDWVKDITATMNDIYEFLGIGEFSNYEDLQTHNQTTAMKNKTLLNLFRNSGVKSILKPLIPSDLGEKVKSKYFTVEGETQNIEDATYNNLRTYFEEDILNLEALINIDVKAKWNRIND